MNKSDVARRLHREAPERTIKAYKNLLYAFFRKEPELNQEVYSEGEYQDIKRRIEERTKQYPVNPQLTLTIFGETRTLSQWSKDPRCEVNKLTLYLRAIRYAWNPEDALVTPSGEKHCKVREIEQPLRPIPLQTGKEWYKRFLEAGVS